MATFYTYIIYNKLNRKFYIGSRQTKYENPYEDIGVRYFSSSTDKTFLKEQIDFPERFKYRVLKRFKSRKAAFEHEIELHEKYDVCVNPRFYNKAKTTTTKFTLSGLKLTEEQKAKRSGENHPLWGKHFSEESRRKMSRSHKGKNAGKDNHFFGKHHTKESRLKMSIARLGNKNRVGSHHSEETKKKISDSKKNLSSETRRKMSLSAKKRGTSEKQLMILRENARRIWIKNVDIQANRRILPNEEIPKGWERGRLTKNQKTFQV